jgi:hypothetical protein
LSDYNNTISTSQPQQSSTSLTPSQQLDPYAHLYDQSPTSGFVPLESANNG